jgi:hemerythrin
MEITRSDLVTFLSTVPGFKDLSKTDLEHKILPIVGVSRFEPGQTILKRGTLSHTLYIIYQGRVHGIAATAQQQEHHFFILEGNVFGESALVSKRRINSTIEATASTICLTLDIDSFQQIMMRDWRFTKAFFILIGTRSVERLIKAEIKEYHWSEKYKIGIPEVDDQHKRLFEAINELGDFLGNEKREENQKWTIQSFMVEILSYIDKHFRDEEWLMEQNQVPWLEEHRKIHQGLATNIIDFKDKVLAISHGDEQLHMMEQIHKVMGNWIIQHIMEEDNRFAHFLKEKKSANRGG